MFASLALASASLVFAAPAFAQEKGAEFGSRDEFVLSLEKLAGYQSQEFGGASLEGLGFHPFFWGSVGLHSVQSSGLTFGVLLGATYLNSPASDSNDESDSLTLLQLRPRIGYAGWLERSLGYWVRIGPTLVMVMNDDDSAYSFGVGGEAYAVVRAAKHVGVLGGIHFDPAIVADEDENEFGSYGLTVGLMGEFF